MSRRFGQAPLTTVATLPRIRELLPDIEGGEPNLLPFSATQQPLRVEFERWQDSSPSPEEPETLTLFWDDDEVDSKTWTSPIPDAELFIMLPQDRMLIDGPHTLRYTVKLHNGNDMPTMPLTITLDRTSPTLPEDSSLVFEPEVITGGVTDAYLQTRNDRLPATIPAYLDTKAGDVLTWYWSTTPGGTDVVDTWTLTLADITAPLKIDFPGDFIRNSGDGIRYARYQVQDRAGTAAQRSLPMVLQINATPIAPNFPAPYLKETGSTGSSSTLDPSRALNGATLVIRPEATFEPNDRVEVYWADPGEHGAFKTTTALSPDSREYAIPKTNVSARLASQLVLYYEVTRRGHLYKSTLHNLTVEAPKNLPTPQCDKIPDNQLSLGNIGTGATFTLGTWQHRNTSQFVTLHITGKRKDNGKDPVMVGEAVPVPSATGTMTVGSVTRADMEVFVVPTGLEIRAFLSVDNQISWIEFPHSFVTLVN
jgi:hypothetical protein